MKKTIVQFLPYAYHIHTGGLEKIAQTLSDEFNRTSDRNCINIASDVTRGYNGAVADTQDTIYTPSRDVVYNYPIPKLRHKKFWHTLVQIKKHKPDVIQTHTRFFLQSMIGGLVAKWLGCKRVHVEHGSGFVTGYPLHIKFLAWLFDRTIGLRIFRQCDAVVTISQTHRKFISKFTNKEAVVIYNPIDYIPHPRVKDHIPHIGYVGRLTSIKGVDLFIKALKQLENTPRTCTIVGEGDQRKKLEQLTQELGLPDRIFFVGSDDRTNWLHTFDIFVNPSHQEGLPTSVVEALIAGCVVVATDVGGTREISDKEDLILCEPSLPSLEKSIKSILSDWHERMHKSKDIVSYNFSVKRAVKKYLSLLKTVIKKDIAFISPVKDGGPKLLYKDLIAVLNTSYPEYEFHLISSAKDWIRLHFYNKKYDTIVSAIPFFRKPPCCRYIVHYHGLYKKERGFKSIGSLLSWLLPYNSIFSDYIIFPSKFLMEKYNIRNKNQKVIYNIFQSPEKVVPKDYPGNKKSLVFTTVTNFHFYDKARGIIDICGKLSNISINKTITYYICGGGKYMQKIAGEIKDIAMPPNINIVFLGNINRKEVLDILAKTDIFLYSTFQETFGIAIIEAMNFGIPVVLNNYGLFYELYNKEFIAKNKGDFIYKLGKLTSDKTYYKDYVNKGFKELEKFDKTKTINKWHELIKEKIS